MRSRLFPLACLATLLAACGGGGDSPLPPEPPANPNPPPAQPEPAKPLPKPVPNALTVMAGSADFSDRHCTPASLLPIAEKSIDWHAVRFYAVERIYHRAEQIYLLSDGGVSQCAGLAHPRSHVHRMDANGRVFEFIHGRMPEILAPLPENRLSGLFFNNGKIYATTIAKTNADQGYALHSGFGMPYADYSRNGPLLIAFTRSDRNPLLISGFDHRMAGLPDSESGNTFIPFDAIDGPPGQARFYAPHSLVTGGDGVQYFVDKGQVRSIDGHLHVRTLTLPSMAEGDVALDLDVDAQGQVHLISQNAAGAYAWHQLASGQRRDFRIEGYGLPHISMAVRAGAQGQTLALAVRDDALPEKWSSVYRVDWAASPAGAATGSAQPRLLLGGAELPATAQDYLQAPSRYRLPNVRDVHFVGQTLWLSVAQAVLAMELE